MAVGSCNAVGHVWVGEFPLLAAGDLPKNAFSSSEQKRYKSSRVSCAIFKNDIGLRTDRIWCGLHYGWIMVELSDWLTACEDVDCIMAGSWRVK
jgi:hypothetical protein